MLGYILPVWGLLYYRDEIYSYFCKSLYIDDFIEHAEIG